MQRWPRPGPMGKLFREARPQNPAGPPGLFQRRSLTNGCHPCCLMGKLSGHRAQIGLRAGSAVETVRQRKYFKKRALGLLSRL